MGKKDITLKAYLSDSRRYADLWNGSLFQGKQVLKAEELSPLDTVQSKSDGQAIVERVNDLAMKQSADGQCYAVWFVANQEKIDYRMPVRVMLQEALEYDRQIKEIQRKNRKLEKFAAYQIKIAGEDSYYSSPGEFLSKVKKEDRLRPVVTMVIYWGTEEWKGAKSLHDIIDFGEEGGCGQKLENNRADGGNRDGDGNENNSDQTPYMLTHTLKKMVPEYPLYFLNLSEITDYSGFQTELRLLFELYARRDQKEEFKRYLQENEDTRNIDIETCWAIGILLNLQELQNYKPKNGERKVDMCKAMREWLEEERNEGIEQGMEQGIGQGTDRINHLGIAMQKAGRVEEFLRSLSDKALQLSLLEEFHLA